ncbi:AAA family ATPase [Anaerococcus cruorum]|uniref:AAA family ATPase n=1 Tax=Anaerococcus sp. WGS1529 TaxID=3366812 RepID=UPI00372D8071
MKPIKLEMRGFITYKDKIDIDFTRLYDKKIFIISGDTGSGKTSIFDAISFALYGKTSRDIPMDKLRSDFLTPEDLYTYVKFSFEVDNKIYQIERIPSQRAKRTKIDQDIKHAASLYDITDEKILLAEKIGDVEKEIINIIGLDKDQFTKVMLLAQGEFQQFLHASSKDRTELLGKIFKTEQYKIIQETIKEKSKASKKDLEYIDKNLQNEIEKDREINDAIYSGERITHDFKVIVEKIENIRASYEKNLTSKKEAYAKENQTYTSLLEQREKDKNLNKNILKFREVNTNLEEKLIDETYYIDLREKREKATYAKNIAIIEENLEKSKTSLVANENQLEKASKLLEEISQEIEKSKENYLLIDEKNKDLDELKISKTKIIDSINSLKEFKKKEQAYLQIEKDLLSISEISKVNEELKEKLEKNRKGLYELNNNLDDKRNESLALEKNLTDLKQSKKEAYDELETYKKNQDLLEKINANGKELLAKEKEQSRLLGQVENFEQNRKIIEINNLIEDLNETGTCPVCGDKHKNHFEKLPVEKIDIDLINKNLNQINAEITKLKTENNFYKESISKVKEIDQILKENSNLEFKIANIEKEKEDLEKSINELLAASKDKKEILSQNTTDIEKNNNLLDQLKEKTKNSEELKIYYQSNKEKMEALDLEILSSDLEKLDKKIGLLEEEIKEINKRHNNLLNQQTKTQTEVKNYKENIKKTKEDIENTTIDLDNKISEKFTGFDEYKSYLALFDEIKTKSDQIDRYFKILEELRINFKNLKEFENRDLVDLEKIENQIKESSQRLGQINEEISNIKVKILSIKDILANIKTLEEKYEKLSDESVILDKLSEIANGATGNVAGRQKVDFETFVLTYYFDRVLNYANKRLLQMSNGQFTMARTSEGQNLRSQSGLDIEILDANTGKTRPASTLSGGESFLASLSLALGLSDEISAENGGITIDTLFIDEGFGTLSDDYLAKVIEQIEKLSYDNKFVGLISHVNELKDAIDGKILVTYREDKGSSLEVIA